MTTHTFHPDTHEHGLQDDCPRCIEHSEHPIQSLDRQNLTRIMRLAVTDDRLGLPVTYLDQVAAGRVLTALENAGQLSRADPVTFNEYMRRWF